MPRGYPEVALVKSNDVPQADRYENVPFVPSDPYISTYVPVPVFIQPRAVESKLHH